MKISRNEPVMKIMVEHHFMLFPKGKNYSWGIGDALRSSKTKVGSCQNHPTRPEAGNSIQKKTIAEWFPSRLLWREINGIWNKRGKNRKGRENQDSKEPG